MAPKKDKDKTPEFMTISGQLCRRVKDASGKFVYRPVQADGSDAGAQTKPKNDVEEEKKWIQMKEREVQEARLRDARQQSAKQMREKEKLGLVEKSNRAREPTVKVPASLQRLREEHEVALKVGMNTSKPGEYILIKEALDIEEKRYQAKVKDAKEKAYKRTRGKLRVAGRAGIGDSDDEEEEEDVALVPKQELHDIDDYRRDMPVKKAPEGRGGPAQPMLWSADGSAGMPPRAERGRGSARPNSARPGRGRGGSTASIAHDNGALDMGELAHALPGPDEGGRGRGRGRRGGGGRGGGRGRGSGGAFEGANGEGGAGESGGRPGSARGRGKGGNRNRGRGRGQASGSGAGAAIHTAG